MTSLAPRSRPGKLVVIGKSGQGQDIVALKVTKDARNVADGEPPGDAVLGRQPRARVDRGRGRPRMPTWWLEHADDPQIADLLGRTELWFLPIQNPDGYDYTFTCGTGFRTADNEMCGATLVTDPANPLRGTYVYKTADGIIRAPNAAQPDPALRKPTNRLWRKTVRDNDGNGRSATARTASTRTATTRRPGASTTRARANTSAPATYRGPFPLSEPEDLAYDRLLRKITPEAVINYHSAAQLLLYPFGYITDVYADDDPWFKALTGTDGDAAVDPYISQRSSDLYITNGETTDHAYNKYGSMSWTPELDECETAAGGTFCSGGSGFTFPDDEGKVEAVFQKNLDFARNVAVTTLDRDRPDRPRNATADETQYQVKGRRTSSRTGSTSPTAPPDARGDARRILGPVDFVVQAPAADRRLAHAHADATASGSGGERFGDLRGKYYHRVRATDPRPTSSSRIGTAQTPRPLVAGDEVNVRVIAGSQQQRFSYRVVSTTRRRRRQAGARGRGRGLHRASRRTRRRTPPAPRYLDEHVAALEANGYAVETFDVDDPPAGPDGEAGPSSSTSASCRTSTPSCTTPATTWSRRSRRRGGHRHDELPPGRANDRRERHVRPHGLAAPDDWGVRNAQMLRNYMNEGGKVVFSGRNGWVQQTSTGTGLTNYSGYTWWQEPVYGFDYPADQAGDDDRPHTAFFRELDISNDWGQWWLGVAARQGGVGRRPTTPRRGRPERAASSRACRRSRSTRPRAPGDAGADAERVDRHAGAAAEVPDAPARSRAWSPPRRVPPGARRGRLRRPDDRQRRGDHLDARLGLGRVRPRAGPRTPRSATSWSRGMGHLLPTTPTPTAPTVTWLRPARARRSAPPTRSRSRSRPSTSAATSRRSA